MRAGRVSPLTLVLAPIACLVASAVPSEIGRQDVTALFLPSQRIGDVRAAVQWPAGTVARRTGDVIDIQPILAAGVTAGPGQTVLVMPDGTITGSLPRGDGPVPGVRVNRTAKADLPLTRVARQESPADAREATADWFAVAFSYSDLAGRSEFTRALPPIVARIEPGGPMLNLGPEPPVSLAYAPLPLARPETGGPTMARMSEISIQTSTDLERAHRCLAEAIYHEARGESERGQQAVAQVVINRARSGYYPSDVCDVIYQNRHWRNRCQFSYACDGRPDTIRDETAWETASRIADDALAGRVFLAEIGDSTHYHATYVAPRWRRGLNRTERIGTHIFYRMPGVIINGG